METSYSTTNWESINPGWRSEEMFEVWSVREFWEEMWDHGDDTGDDTVDGSEIRLTSWGW